MSFASREIRDVLHEADATPELTLDVVAGDGSPEHGTISMTWSRSDLEKLLDGASGDDVVLTFDRNELTAALGDVESHGMRERAAVFAVAVVGAIGVSAAAANAQVVGGEGGGPASAAVTAPAFTDASSTGGYAAPSQSDAAAALQSRSQALNEEYGLTADAQSATAALETRSLAMDEQAAAGDAASGAMVTDASSTGGYAAPSQGDDAAALQARSQALNEEYGLTSGPQAAARALEARSVGMDEQAAVSDSAAAGIVTDASTGGGYAAPPTASVGGGGFELQAPSTDDALLAGAALIVIAGAAFAARRGTLHRA
ncbi:MAG TPA: hypothetical protein VLK36_10510 [Gaiellaceae bacterium]|nr:hypothetical protein [Gaiellaceae bacterium]